MSARSWRRGWLALLFVLLPVGATAQPEWDAASAVVDGATREMVQLLSDPELRDEAHLDRLMAALDGVLSPVVDFDRIARGVMAKYFRRASRDQQQRFAEVFKGTLLKTYAKALSAFEIERYEILPNVKPSDKPDKQVVRVDVFGTSGTRYSLVYFMVDGSRGWRLTNVLLDGINLRQIFRNQFAEAVNGRQGDIDRVIADWAGLVDSSATPPAAGNGADANAEGEGS